MTTIVLIKINEIDNFLIVIALLLREEEKVDERRTIEAADGMDK